MLCSVMSMLSRRPPGVSMSPGGQVAMVARGIALLKLK